MGGGTPRATHQAPLAAPSHFRHSCALSPSFLRRQEPGDFPVWRAALPHSAGRPHRITPEQTQTNLNKPEHRQTPRPDRRAPRITPNKPKKTILNTSRHPTQPTPTLFPNSSLPPFRGEVRWGVGRREPRTKPRSQRRATSVVSAPPPRHSCAGRNPPTHAATVRSTSSAAPRAKLRGRPGFLPAQE